MRTACGFLLVLLLGGCAKSEFPLGQVTGQVSVAGQPLADSKLEAQIFFFPEPKSGDKKQLAGKRGWARIGPDGKFQVSTYGEFDGAVVGKHRVAISVTDSTNVPFDRKYLSVDTSGLTFDIVPGSNKADFNLDAGKKK